VKIRAYIAEVIRFFATTLREPSTADYVFASSIASLLLLVSSAVLVKTTIFIVVSRIALFIILILFAVVILNRVVPVTYWLLLYLAIALEILALRILDYYVYAQLLLVALMTPFIDFGLSYTIHWMRTEQKLYKPVLPRGRIEARMLAWLSLPSIVAFAISLALYLLSRSVFALVSAAYSGVLGVLIILRVVASEMLRRNIDAVARENSLLERFSYLFDFTIALSRRLRYRLMDLALRGLSQRDYIRDAKIAASATTILLQITPLLAVLAYQTLGPALALPLLALPLLPSRLVVMYYNSIVSRRMAELRKSLLFYLMLMYLYSKISIHELATMFRNIASGRDRIVELIPWLQREAEAVLRSGRTLDEALLEYSKHIPDVRISTTFASIATQVKTGTNVDQVIYNNLRQYIEDYTRKLKEIADNVTLYLTLIILLYILPTMMVLLTFISNIPTSTIVSMIYIIDLVVTPLLVFTILRRITSLLILPQDRISLKLYMTPVAVLLATIIAILLNTSVYAYVPLVLAFWSAAVYLEYLRRIKPLHDSYAMLPDVALSVMTNYSTSGKMKSAVESVYRQLSLTIPNLEVTQMLRRIVVMYNEGRYRGLWDMPFATPMWLGRFLQIILGNIERASLVTQDFMINFRDFLTNILTILSGQRSGAQRAMFGVVIAVMTSILILVSTEALITSSLARINPEGLEAATVSMGASGFTFGMADRIMDILANPDAMINVFMTLRGAVFTASALSILVFGLLVSRMVYGSSGRIAGIIVIELILFLMAHMYNRLLDIFTFT